MTLSNTTLRNIFVATAAALLALATVAIATAAQGQSPATPDNPLVKERWKTRPLVVVAPGSSDPLLRSVQSALDTPSEKRAFTERDMVLYTVVAGRGEREGRPLSPHQTKALLAALSIGDPAQSALVLIGKDGGAKLAQTGETADLRAIFAEIDGMPMRRNGR